MKQGSASLARGPSIPAGAAPARAAERGSQDASGTAHEVRPCPTWVNGLPPPKAGRPLTSAPPRAAERGYWLEDIAGLNRAAVDAGVLDAARGGGLINHKHARERRLSDAAVAGGN